jgi:hypothetical protein
VDVLAIAASEIGIAAGERGMLGTRQSVSAQGNADFQIGKHELYSKPTRKPGNTVFDSLTRRVTKLRSFKN